MSQNLQLIERENHAISMPTESEFGVMLQQSQMLVKTGFLPKAIDTPEKAMAIILTGRELGIPTMCALRSIDVIQGKPTVSPQLMMALIERSGQLENKEIKAVPGGMSCMLKRRGRAAHTETFTMDDAKKLCLTEKDNYKKQPTTMMRWRAIASCARVVFPDVILGLYTPEEMGADVLEESGLETVPPLKQQLIENARMTSAEADEFLANESFKTPGVRVAVAGAENLDLHRAKGKTREEKAFEILKLEDAVERRDDNFIVTELQGEDTLLEFTVSKDAAGKVGCNCDDYLKLVQRDAAFRCEHILAVKYDLLEKQKQAAA